MTMTIKRYLVPESTIEAFAITHGLVMVVRERSADLSEYGRYYAKFSDVDLHDGHFYCTCCGDGDSEEAAIEDYAQKISEQVVSVGPRPRRDIRVPRLIPLK